MNEGEILTWGMEIWIWKPLSDPWTMRPANYFDKLRSKRESGVYQAEAISWKVEDRRVIEDESVPRALDETVLMLQKD